LVIIGLFHFTGLGRTQIQEKSLFLNQEVTSEGDVDRWLAQDKIKHLLGSFFLTGAMIYYFHYHGGLKGETSIQYGVACSVFLGFAKEINDKRYPNKFFSWKDLLFDLLGCILGWMVLGGW